MGTWKRVQEYASHILHPLESLHLRISGASLVLILDATYLKVRGKEQWVYIAYDTAIGVIHFALDDSENATGYATILNMLAVRGYKPIVVVSDGHGGIISAISDWSIPHQRCVFHIIKSMREFLSFHGELRGGNTVLYSRMKSLLKSTTIEVLADRVNQFRKILFCFRTPKQKEAIKKFWNVLHEATLHLSFNGEVPNTSNILENLNGQIKARTKTMRGVKSKHSLFNLLKILFHFRDYK